ncbi:MAG: CheR family methyltransferase, partial [Gemmatimonadaceae bacterium]
MSSTKSSTKSGKDFEALLEYLKRNRGFDFTGYKRTSLARRIDKRMAAVDVGNYADYVDYLEVHPEEFVALFNTILINVTSFFRDDSTWDYLGEHVLPALIARKGPLARVRVWSAGCASGEEAFSLAVAFAEKMGPNEFRERVKIYATDVDEEALAKGRQATYSDREVAGVPTRLLTKYFDSVNGSYVFRKDLRRQVIFGRHDLINDAPISRVDLLVCRNTLMYLNAETQARILARFHFALNDGGVLFLGRAETLLTHANTFQPIDAKRRISTKVPRGNLDLRDRLILMAQGVEESSGVANEVRLRDIALDANPVAQIVVDANGTLALANDRARDLFHLSPGDQGRALQDLKISYRPIELRSLVDQTQQDRRVLVVRDVEWKMGTGDVRWLDVQLSPLFDGGAYLGTSVSFLDVSAPRRLQRDLEHARQELEAAYEELQSTNEELETTNEELQSTIEELETTNEELQSTNEELET